jgi:hypothetical protein
MLKFLDELIWQYFWCIVGTFDKFWNEYTKYGVSKMTFKQCNQWFLLQKRFFKSCEMILNNNFMRKTLCTHLHYSIMQHLFESQELKQYKSWFGNHNFKHTLQNIPLIKIVKDFILILNF